MTDVAGRRGGAASGGEAAAAVGGADRLTARRGRPFTIGMVSGGLGAYWEQFPALQPALRANAAEVAGRLGETGAEVFDAGFVSDAPDAAAAAERLRSRGCDLVVVHLATYLTSSMVLPVAQHCGAPILVVDLQPTASMDHATFGTGDWLAYCGACSLPEVANVFERCSVAFRSVSGHLRDERAWERIFRWVGAARVAATLRHSRHGLLGHLYPGMYDVSTDLTMVPANLGGHVEVLELDDLRVRVQEAGSDEVEEHVARARRLFELDPSVDPEDLSWAARVSAGLERLVADFGLDSLAYYHRGLGGELHERLGAGLILGASLLSASGVPTCGEYELRTSIAMLIMECLGAGGSFSELQALNFTDGVVEMGHDGPAHLAIGNRRPLLRGLDLYHGKRGWGVSVELEVAHGPVTAVGLTQRRDGRWGLVVSEGEVVGGPLLRIGNTTSRVDFGRDPGEWCDEWAATGVAHHWALATGHRLRSLRAVGDLLGLEVLSV